MSLNRFYCENIAMPVTELTGIEAHHLASVRRLKTGDKIELFDGRGNVAVCSVQTASSRKVSLAVKSIERAEPSAGGKIVLAVSVAKGDRFDWLIAKATELGIDRIMPIIFERTVKQPKNPKIVDRWKNIAISSCKQSKRVYLPEIDSPMLLAECIEVVESHYPERRLIFGDPAERKTSLIDLHAIDGATVAFVGPEGGFAADEIKLLEESGTQAVYLTDTVLRVETAALAFAAILTARRDSTSDRAG